MSRHIISMLVENHAGVLSRVSGLFSRRGYNIDSLSVGVTEDPNFSRVTVVARGDGPVIEQICSQVAKLVDVVKVKELLPEESVYRELALVKVCAPAGKRAEIAGIVDIFRGNIIDVSNVSMTVEITGDQGKLAAFTELMAPYGLMETARTGLIGLERGQTVIKNHSVSEEEL
jgi:acetolactate synthase-1/3 small subunit